MDSLIDLADILQPIPENIIRLHRQVKIDEFAVNIEVYFPFFHTFLFNI